MEGFEKNQNKSGWGGKRIGAGRPVGTSESATLKKKLRDYLGESEIENLIDIARIKAREDSRVLIFLLEQILGKARQNLGLDGGEDGKKLIIQIAKEISEKNNIIPDDSNESTDRDS